MRRKHQDIIDQLTLKEKASLISGKDFWQSMNIDRLNLHSPYYVYQDEEGDMYWAEQQLALIELIGKQNWLAKQL